MRIVYVDLSFCLDLLADYLLCLAAGRSCGLYLKRGRYLLAAVLGAVYSLLVQILGPGPLVSLPAKAAVWLAMAWIAFGSEERPWRCALVMLLLAALFGGCCYALTLLSGAPVRASPGLLVSAFLLCYAFLRLLTGSAGRRKARQRSLVRVTLLGREACFQALQDNGNALCDPASGAGALVASPHALGPLLGDYLPLFEELGPVELLEALSKVPALSGRFRLLPYRALGGQGMLPAFRPDGLWIDGREDRERLVAVSVNARGDDFEAII